MNKVLIIANLLHAYPRIPGITTYLKDYGWEPTILTIPVDITKLGTPPGFENNVRIIEAKYRGDMFWPIRIVLRWFGFKDSESMIEQMKSHARTNKPKKLIEYIAYLAHDLLAYPDPEFTWQRPVIKRASQLLEAEHFDLILSSSPHPTTQIVASKISKKFDIPWIAEFRDSWVANHYYVHNRLRKHIETKLEKDTLANCKYIIAATPMIMEKQEQLHHKPTSIIYNGYDENNINNPAIKLADKFTITYTGTIYPYKQSPLKFLQALKNTGIQDIEVRFYGQKYSWLQDIIDKLELGNFVHQYGKVSRNEVTKKQQESHVLLTFNWEDASEKGVCPLKFFEYLAARRPILATGGIPIDAVEIIMGQTQSGSYCETTKKIEDTIRYYYGKYINHDNTFSSNTEEVNKFSYRNLAKQFTEVFNEVSK